MAIVGVRRVVEWSSVTILENWNQECTVLSGRIYLYLKCTLEIVVSCVFIINKEKLTIFYFKSLIS